MMTFHQLLSSRLEKLRPNHDGTLTARCPICALAGADKSGQHLKIWPHSGAFCCIVSVGDTSHNRGIRAHLYSQVDEETLLQLSLSSIDDPAPKLDIDPVYPEELLTQLVPDYRYWVGRGVNEDVLRLLEGGLYPPDRRGKMEGRFVFPIRHHVTRKIMGWTGRLVDEEQSFGPKHKHLVRVSRCIYPLTATAPYIKEAQSVVILESVGDALALMSHGIRNVLVLLGLNLNSAMLGYLVSANLSKGIIISTNNDAIGTKDNKKAGNRGAEKIRDRLIPFLGEDKVKIRLPCSSKDWGGADLEEIAVFRAEIEGKL